MSPFSLSPVFFWSSVLQFCICAKIIRAVSRKIRISSPYNYAQLKIETDAVFVIQTRIWSVQTRENGLCVL